MSVTIGRPKKHGHLVHAHRLPIPLGVRHPPKLPLHVVLGAATRWWPSTTTERPRKRARPQTMAASSTTSGRHCSEVGEDALDVVERVDRVTVGVTRQLHLLPGRQLGEELAGEPRPACLRGGCRSGLEAGVGLGELAKLAHAGHELDDGLLKEDERRDAAIDEDCKITRGGGGGLPPRADRVPSSDQCSRRWWYPPNSHWLTPRQTWGPPPSAAPRSDGGGLHFGGVTSDER